METIDLFDGLTAEERSVANAGLKPYVIGAGEELLREGEADRSLLIVVDGELMISLGDVELARVGVGDMVGEMALFGTFDRRSATVTTTVGPTHLLILDEDALRFLRVQSNPMVRNLEAFALRALFRRIRDMEGRIAGLLEYEPVPSQSLLGRLGSVFGPPAPDARDVLGAVPGFANRDPQALTQLAAQLQLVSVPKGRAITTRGEDVADAYMVAIGSVGVWHPGENDYPTRSAVLEPGHMFGRVGSTLDPVSLSTTYALEPTWLLRFPSQVTDELELGSTPEAVTYRRGMIDVLSTQLRVVNENFLSTVLRSTEPE